MTATKAPGNDDWMSSHGLRILPAVSLAIVALALGHVIHKAPTPASTAPPRNVILISLDTLRADHLGAWGYKRETSPRLDALSKKSVLFRRAVAQGSSTLPSHASLFTSQYASSVDGAGSGLLAEPETLAETLSRQGFATWGFVDGGNLRAHFGFGQGFEHYEDDRIGIRLLVARAKRWIEQHPVPRFFLFLHTYEIHTPYTAPPEYVRLFGDPDYKGGFHPGASYLTSIERRGGVLDEREHREVVARYDAGIRHTDEWVGDFIDWLEERGLLADALVVILSDHGEEFLEHGRFGHHQLYLDPNLRVPLLFHQRGLAPRVVDQTVELTDVVPTILEALGLPLSSRSVGRSLVPILRGEKAPEGRIAYAEKGAHPGEQTVITDRYQLIRNRKTEELRLYDLLADPEAKRDIAAEQPDLATRLGAELEKRRKRARKSLQENFGAAPRKEASQPLDDKIRRELELLGYLEQ